MVEITFSAHTLKSSSWETEREMERQGKEERGQEGVNQRERDTEGQKESERKTENKSLCLARTFIVPFVRVRKPCKNGSQERTNVWKRESGYDIMDKRDNGVTKVGLLHGINVLQKISTKSWTKRWNGESPCAALKINSHILIQFDLILIQLIWFDFSYNDYVYMDINTPILIRLRQYSD